ncbi:hypothetical protein ACFVAG_10670 [Streptomyces sp. NPDC057644]|uniref:hypothetical protein n=1 Tax=Streptomyces sp. NPDC057644 TaxID=3346191 RepID=UPI0036B98C66
MNFDGGGTQNLAFDSTVGIQAEVVHNPTVNLVHPDATPQEKYRVGVRFLEQGVPSRARDLMSDAIAHGYDTPEVRFHWALAMLSGRSYHDLSAEETGRLRHASGLVRGYPAGEWTEALVVAFELLTTRGSDKDDTDRVRERLHSLPVPRRDALLHHFDLVLTGALKDSLWADSRRSAEASRFAGERRERVWAYFDPEPIGARATAPRPSTAAEGRAALPLRAGLSLLAFAVLWLLALTAAPATALLELLLALGAGWAAAKFGRSWWYEGYRLKSEKENEPYVPSSPELVFREDGFTDSVRHAFDDYFGARVPQGVAPQQWLDQTFRMRHILASETAALYRESRVGVERIIWLINYLAEDTRARYVRGELFDQPARDRTPAGTKALCVGALAVLAVTALALVRTAAHGGFGATFFALLAVGGAFWAGRSAVFAWLKVTGEARRLAEETDRYQRELAIRQVAFQNYKGFLDDQRPSEQEMETWLACDKTLFVDEVLRHYQLTWRDLITHTLLVTPARPYMRGRVKGGPWRYSRYSFRLFLVTQDGIREVSTDLDFADGKRSGEQRSNYRFDALSSVQVTERDRAGYDLELILTNGPARNIRVKDADTHQLAPEEDAREMTEINLNAAGFIHTFRLLEGIAAEGKGWIDRNNPNDLPPFPAD